MKLTIKLAKQPQKYLKKVSTSIRNKLIKALKELALLEGDIKPLKGTGHLFRYKIEQYRIIFSWVKGEITIEVIEINSRTNIKYRRY